VIDLRGRATAEIMVWLKAFGCTQQEAEDLMLDIVASEERSRARRDREEPTR
jgi:hypothetical protein